MTTAEQATRPTKARAPKHAQPTAAMPKDEEPSQASTGGSRSVSAWTMLGFIAGCAILIVAAINLPNLGRWGDEHGNVVVFLCFFLVMSIGGRWFWAGVDALWGAIRGKGN